MSRTSSPFAAPPPRKAPKVKRDTDQERAEKNYVRARDNGCVASRAAQHGWHPGTTASLYLDPGVQPNLGCDGPLDVDHVRASGGLGMKSPTHRTNMVVLCRHHHRLKTDWGKTWRPLLIAYLERVER
jgi:5-methylcytosine-specific restriction endonuclease McrA